jgi:hypothetical protein
MGLRQILDVLGAATHWMSRYTRRKGRSNTHVVAIPLHRASGLKSNMPAKEQIPSLPPHSRDVLNGFKLVALGDVPLNAADREDHISN